MSAPTLKTKKKIKHENTTKMCIVHSTLRDATTPYTERCTQAEKKIMGHKKVCLNCRKAFNQNSDFEIQSGFSCPECGQKMVEVNHKFRPPKKADLKSWNVVKFLIENGFLYQHVYKNIDKRNGLVSKEN